MKAGDSSCISTVPVFTKKFKWGAIKAAAREWALH